MTLSGRLSKESVLYCKIGDLHLGPATLFQEDMTDLGEVGTRTNILYWSDTNPTPTTYIARIGFSKFVPRCRDRRVST